MSKLRGTDSDCLPVWVVGWRGANLEDLKWYVNSTVSLKEKTSGKLMQCAVQHLIVFFPPSRGEWTGALWDEKPIFGDICPQKLHLYRVVSQLCLRRWRKRSTDLGGDNKTEIENGYIDVGSEAGVSLCIPLLYCIWREFTAGLYKFSAPERVSPPSDL